MTKGLLEKTYTFVCSIDTFPPGGCGSVGWASFCKAKGHQFDSRSGHIPGLCVKLILLRGVCNAHAGVHCSFLCVFIPQL